jgi:hypothetical protein
MELEPRTEVPAHATGAVQFVPLSSISDDATFRLREEGDVSALASSLGRLGQLVPVELRLVPGAPEDTPRYQVVAGFRRIAAVRLLRRERVLARVHLGFGDEDAWSLALVQALLTAPLDRAALEALRDRVDGLAPWAADLLDGVMNEPEAAAEPEAGPDAAAQAEVEPAAAPEGEPVEMTPEELANDVATRLYEVNADLAVAYESWADLPPEGRRAIIEQARWTAALLPMLEAQEE